ncbi:MAG: hypothetical protein EP333_07580 [Bacteroidetes bacterium]|nr:MAG: hypothetical protein EP333_07580 [Bacteroidota bacterium]
MKQALLPILLFLFSVFSFAQSDSISKVHSFGVAANTSLNTYYGGLLNAILATYSNGNHQIEIGPKFNFESSKYYKNRFGAELNYKYFPNSLTQRFTPFLQLNTEFYNSKREDESMQPYENPTDLVARKVTRRYYAFHAGYGIQFRLYKGLYISTDVGLGLVYEDYDKVYTSANPDLNHTEGYFHQSLSFRTALTLGYRF